MSEKLAASSAFSQDAEVYSTLHVMVDAKKQELKDLQALMVKEQGYLKKLRDNQVKERQSVEQELRLRRQQFEKEIAIERQGLRDLQRNLEQVSQDIDAQRKELDVLVANAEGIRREREQATQDRIAMEQQRIRASELKEQSESALHKLHSAQAEFESIKQSTDEWKAKVEQQDRINQAKEEELSHRERTIKLDLEQLVLLRKEVDPKLEQLTLRENQIKDQLLRIEATQRENAEHKAESIQACADLEGLAKRLEGKETQLNERELRLKQLQSDLYVKIQQAKAKGIDIAVPTEPSHA